MSDPVDEGGGVTPDQAALKRLENAFVLLMKRLEGSAAEVRAANDRVAEIEGKNTELTRLVQRFTGDEAAATDLVGRLKRLESENAALRGRLDAGRAGVDRMIARIKFLENQ